jgi:hypothetical protein
VESEMIEKKSGFDLNLALAEVSKIREIHADGSMTTQQLGALDEWMSYFRSALFSRGKTQAFMNVVIKKALRASQKMSEEEFMREAKKTASIMDKNDRKLMRVVFPIWGGDDILSGRRKTREVWMDFTPRTDTEFYRRIQLERRDQLVRMKEETGEFPDVEELRLAVCSVKGINDVDSFEQAEDAISTELGLVSVLLGRGRSIIPENPKKPVANVLIAPQMTVHSRSGSFVRDMFWADEWPIGIKKAIFSPDERDYICKNLQILRNSTKNHPWRNRVEIVLAKHYLAFSRSDSKQAFLDAWRLLEYIAGPDYSKGDLYVSRAAFFFQESNIAKQIGLHLLHRRNSISHGSVVEAHDGEVLRFQIRRLLRPILMNFIRNPYKFKNVEEFWSFCDVPKDKNLVRRRMHVLKSAEKYRG